RRKIFSPRWSMPPSPYPRFGLRDLQSVILRSIELFFYPPIEVISVLSGLPFALSPLSGSSHSTRQASHKVRAQRRGTPVRSSAFFVLLAPRLASAVLNGVRSEYNRPNTRRGPRGF